MTLYEDAAYGSTRRRSASGLTAPRKLPKRSLSALCWCNRGTVISRDRR